MDKQIELDIVDASEATEIVDSDKETTKAEVAEVKEHKSTELSANPFNSTDDFKNYWNMAKMLASSDMIPQAYQNKPMNVVIALEQAQRMNTSPLMVMQNLYIVKGKPSWSGQACSMIVNGCGLFENVKLNYVGKKGQDDWGAYVSAVRKSDKELIIGTTIDMAMAKTEGWTQNPKWKSMPQQMLGYRAYTFFARLYCPNALCGFQTEGEIEDANCRATVKTDNPF